VTVAGVRWGSGSSGFEGDLVAEGFELPDVAVLDPFGAAAVVEVVGAEVGKPPFYLLEAHGFEVWLCNAKDVKHLPGRPKTDRLDAVWLCKIAERQMIRPSFVPPAPIRRLRDLTRYRVALIGDRTGEKNRVELIRVLAATWKGPQRSSQRPTSSRPERP